MSASKVRDWNGQITDLPVTLEVEYCCSMVNSFGAGALCHDARARGLEFEADVGHVRHRKGRHLAELDVDVELLRGLDAVPSTRLSGFLPEWPGMESPFCALRPTAAGPGWLVASGPRWSVATHC